MPARQRTVLKWNLFTGIHWGRVTSGSTKTGPGTEREEGHGAALSLQRSHVKVFLDPHHIPNTSNWIFNQGTEPMIKFLLSVAHEIYQESATTNQYQKHS